MAGLARFFVSDRYQRSLFVAIWVTVSLICLIVVAVVFLANLRGLVGEQTQTALAPYIAQRERVQTTFDSLEEALTATPCSPQFLSQLRRVAYLPDGINEFLYADGDRLLCSVNMGVFDAPADPGPPDIGADNALGTAYWFDRNLNFLDMPEMTGSLLQRGSNVIVLPDDSPSRSLPNWLDYEVVVQAADGERMHRAGVLGIHDAAVRYSGSVLPVDGGYYGAQCDPGGIHCVATKADIVRFLSDNVVNALLAFVAIKVFAALITQFLYGRMRAYWSFPARFKRHLEEGLVCTYQPLVAMRTGQIAGCEVLVRWRDLDGQLVYPDRFLSLVERENLTVRLSQAVVSRALSALAGRVPTSSFQINFNIFPRDFEPETLKKIFDPRLAHPGLSIAAEIVETETLAIERIQAAVTYLSSRGIATYIDDFGVGYSNLQNLALLSIDGVKIDRSFAMAPDNTLMARILGHAIEMAHESGRAIVIEGVETRERFEMLKANPFVDYAQGYFISRSLEIESFLAFIASWTPPETATVRAASGATELAT